MSSLLPRSYDMTFSNWIVARDQPEKLSACIDCLKCCQKSKQSHTFEFDEDCVQWASANSTWFLPIDSLKHHSGATEALFAKRCLPFAA